MTVARGDPGAHRESGSAAPEQREEPERGWPLVGVGDPGYQVDPSVLGGGQSRHGSDDLRELFGAEFHSLDLSLPASHAGSIAVGNAPEWGFPAELIHLIAGRSFGVKQ